MKLSKVLHVASVLSGVLGVISLLSILGGGWTGAGMMGGMMGYGQGMMPMGGVVLLLIAIWLQIGAIHHMMLEKQGEIV